MKIIIFKKHYNNIKVRATALFLALITLIFTLSFTPVSSASDQSGEESNNSVISGRLEEAMKDATEDTTFYVLLWFVDDSKADISLFMTNKLGMSEKEWKVPLSEKTTLDEIHEYKTQKAQISAEVYTKNNNNIAKKYFNSEEISYISRYSPVILAYLSKEKILKIADSENIDSIDLYFGDKATTCSSPADEMEASCATLAKNTYGYDGNGVKVGIADINVPFLDAAPGNGLPSGCVYYIDPDGVEVAGSTHATACGNIIANVAPEAELYFTGGNDTLEGIEWLVDQGVDVISMSMSIGNSNYTNSYTSYSRWYDHIEYEHFITMCLSSGNSGDATTSCG